MSEQILSRSAPAPIGPYSQAVESGGWIFCSGQIPLDPSTGAILGDDAADQARQVLANLDAILQAAKLRRSDIVRTTIYLVDLAEFASVNGVYAEFFASCPTPPARSTVQVSALPKGALVEIDAIAIRDA